MEVLKILIVDDKPENIVALEALLDRDDIELVTTTSPNEALRLCWEQDISIALVDVQMPQMDGFELVEILKGNPRTREILVIFVTAISMETKYAVKGYSTGAIDYLYKPLDPYVTSAKVDSFIQLACSQREVKRKNAELLQYQKELIIAKEQAEQGKRIKENFLASMSHEIRTPVNGIQGLIHLLQYTNLDEEQIKLLDLLKISSGALLGIINDILDISKIEAGKFKIVRAESNIINQAHAIIGLLQYKAVEKGIELKVDIEKAVPAMIIVDSLRINQILMNLIGNAVKFTDKGSVTLFVKLIATKGNQAQIRFVVQDTGIGIESDKLDTIFDSFEQADDNTQQLYGGTGLGLSIAKRLAELKGGEITVFSEFGKGASFVFTNWYQVVSDPEINASVDLSELPFLEGLEVLVAEDNLVNQFMIKKVLERWKIEVEMVENGALVLERLKTKTYDLLLIDSNMPVMGGFEAIRKIRADISASISTIPIISLSAAVLDEEQQRALDAGANDIITKPFDLSVLHHKIKKWTRKVLKKD
ncbi:response regulator [Arcticibacter eurypsychrophilus]|uniref:response regulator n=1 Tax=Arcticibacter eurypsychrophilus TaxID=1434752 RepID=UPI00084DC82B|nr:response regulator [Arcticibacter eurypsychrophilus]